MKQREDLQLLKYLRVSGGAVAGAQRAPAAATTIAASAWAACKDGGGGVGVSGGDVDDDTTFFELEFAVPGDESAASDAEEERVEFNFAMDGDDDGKEEDATEADKMVEVVASVSPLGPVNKFSVMLLKLRRPTKAPAAAADGAAPAAPAPKQAYRFLIKFRMDETAPLTLLFMRDNSSRISDADRPVAVAAVVQAHKDVAT
ncbi:hypothetical protein U9M48_029531 [Paspalum notatum var. saurae]|uniref:Uncharacterized protein n=1 Tax=Paspalum notatum var. saurae TaxID=547442 RepID=A0AAQ3TYR7_PASNO